MKVREIIAQLQNIDPEIDVLCYTEDKAVLSLGHGFRLFDIEEISVVDGTRIRGEDQIPTMKLGKGPNSQKHSFIEITSDF